MTDGAETRRQFPENFDARLARLTDLYHDHSRQEAYQDELALYEEGAKGNLPDDLELALWDPEDYKTLRERHQQTIQGESI